MDAVEEAYSSFFRAIDPVRAAAERAASDGVGLEPGSVYIERELVPEDAFLRSEFYAEFGKRYGQRHMLVSRLGNRHGTVLGLHRAERAGPFTDQERSVVAAVMPHLQRALQLREQLARAGEPAGSGFAALDALSLSIILVDPDLRVIFANMASADLLGRRGSGLSLRHTGPWQGSHSCRLTARHHDEHAALKAFVAAAAAGQPGGALRLRGRDQPGDATASLAVLVSPAPARLVVPANSPTHHGLVEGVAMVIARDIAAPLTPPAPLLRELFGLTPAEAAVAISLLGGRTAEEVALARQASLDTVRSQIRSLLRKTDAANLRDLERIGALLTTMAR
jgi:DNA-binding CsgD family transcriptional regulator